MKTVDGAPVVLFCHTLKLPFVKEFGVAHSDVRIRHAVGLPVLHRGYDFLVVVVHADAVKHNHRKGEHDQPDSTEERQLQRHVGDERHPANSMERAMAQ